MIAIAILFIILGILIKYGKMYFLIAGYNTMPKKEKEKYNISGIATVFRNTMFGMGLIIILGYFAAEWFKNSDIENIALYGVILIGLPYLLIKSNSKKYKKIKIDNRQPTIDNSCFVWTYFHFSGIYNVEISTKKNQQLIWIQNFKFDEKPKKMGFCTNLFFKRND